MARFGYSKLSSRSSVCWRLPSRATHKHLPRPRQLCCPTRTPAAACRRQIQPVLRGLHSSSTTPATCPKLLAPKKNRNNESSADGDVVYLNAGSQQGIKEGQTFQIIRPRGDVKGVHKQKYGFVGTYIQDVGQLQVFKVRENTSAAADHFFVRHGSARRSAARRFPIASLRCNAADGNLDRFADPSGKQTGRLMMAKDSREMVTRNDIVYIDLGSEDQIKTWRLPHDLSSARHR